MKDLIKEILTEWPDYNTEELTGVLYNHETNFNNADPTSQQRVYLAEEILEMIEQAKTHLKDV